MLSSASHSELKDTEECCRAEPCHSSTKATSKDVAGQARGGYSLRDPASPPELPYAGSSESLAAGQCEVL
jgi:hypothetical protein